MGFTNPQEVYKIIDGLPPGTTIELTPIHQAFHCQGTNSTGPCIVEPGGGLGGEREVFDAKLAFQLVGTGDLNGFRRILWLDTSVETHTAPRTPGDPVQNFDTEMFILQGALAPGDPDFAQLQILGGRGANPLLPPSFGHTILTSLPGGTFDVDSFFDIHYEITFIGAPGGALAGLSGITAVPLTSILTDSAPRTPGQAVQAFIHQLISLSGSLPPGDPDFSHLTISAGQNQGLPSRGFTLLEDLGNGSYRVDSFFDVEYRITFTGAVGGALEGLGGTTTAEVTLAARQGENEAVEADDGTGTVTLPAESSSYLALEDRHQILEGLPPGSSIEMEPTYWFFVCDAIPCGQPGGNLGGEVETFQSTLSLDATGTGTLVGLKRQIQIPVAVETHSGPRQPVAPLTEGAGSPPPQSFDTDIFHLKGQIFGDPDFSQLSIRAGTSHAMPSPGHTTLTDLGDGTFRIDSFFDIEYEIEFVGAPGGQLDGMNGATTGTTRVTAVDETDVPAHNVTIALDVDPDDTTDVDFGGDFGSFTLDEDPDPTWSTHRLFSNLSPGIYQVTQTLPACWSVWDIVCNDPSGETLVDPGNETGTIDVDLGESFTCTFSTGLDFSQTDSCGVCGGDNSSCSIFSDGFESGNTTAWSVTVN